MIINNPGDLEKDSCSYFLLHSFIHVDGSIALASKSVIVERGRGGILIVPLLFSRTCF